MEPCKTDSTKNKGSTDQKLALIDDPLIFSDSTKASENLSSEQKFEYILNYKDFKGFKKIKNIKERYKIGKVLGSGSFASVRIAQHRKANIKCAIKIIKKDKV